MKLTAIVTALFAVVATVGAQAATSSASDMTMHEIIFNATRATGGNLNFASPSGGGNTTTTFGLSAGYNYQFMPGLQVGLLNGGFNYASTNGTSVTQWDFLAGITLNWPMTDKLDNAFFVDAGAGLVHVNATVAGVSASANKFQFGFEAGKRFTLTEHVNYRPSVSYVKVTDVGGTFAINFLAFSATF